MTTVEHAEFASPLSLVEQWGERGDGAPLRELLILGYTVDLAFLERFCVPRARQLGARITVLSDADHVLHDAVDVRLAGSAYQFGTASIAGAFHPKLALLVGDDDIRAAVGSGNPTLSGWSHNRELWCVLRGRTDDGLRAQADLGEWLRRLPVAVPMMPSWIVETLINLGHRVTPTVVDDSRPDVRLLHNLDGPILDRLPGMAPELNLTAPFVDPSGSILSALVERTRPQLVRVALQRGLGTFDGRTLVGALRRTTAEFREVDDRRTVHGKLIEYVDAHGAVVSVIGSPNLTTAALGRSVDDGGNCELAISAATERSLFPDAPVVPTDEVGGWRRTPEPDRADLGLVLRLLGVRRSDDGVVVELLCARAVDVRVEVSLGGAPGSWETRLTVPAATIAAGTTTRIPLALPEPTGAAVRLVATTDGVMTWSHPAFVTDTQRCRPRTDVGSAPRLREIYDIDAIITDADLLERFGRDLARLLRHAAGTRATAAPARTPLGPASRARRDGWSEFVDLAEHALGVSLLDLALPGALPSPTPSAATSSWTVGAVEDETELAEDESEDEIEHLDPAVTRVTRRVPPTARARYRAWIRSWVRTIDPPTGSAPPLVLRMTVAALHLELLAAGVWGADEDWRDLLATIVRSLVADADEIDAAPPESYSYLGALVAVCLAVLSQDATVRGGRPRDIVLAAAWEPAHWITTLAQDEIVEALLLRSDDGHARLATRGEVAAVIDLATAATADPHAETIVALAADGIDVRREGGAWVAQGTFRNPRRAAARMATDLFDGDGLTCLATTETRAVLIVRGPSTLAMLDSMVGRWLVHALRWPFTPQSMLAEGLPPIVERHLPLPVPAAASAIAGGADLNSLVRGMRCFLRDQ